MSRARKKQQVTTSTGLEKCPTGIPGLDLVTCGGLPRGRTTLVCGGSGSGKTLLGVEFLVMGARDHGEPGVFMSFEEKAEELTQNVASLGFNLDTLAREEKLVIDFVRVERREFAETGEYDLDGLFARLGYSIDSIGAKRVVLDTIETLFAALDNDGILRAELRRLFRWLKDKGVTAIVTGERGDGTLTRHGLEEYISDCVILLDQRVADQVATRRLRIVKYRGSAHGTNEYPFLLDEHGFTVVPLTAIGLQYGVSTDFVSTGIPKLDAMMGGHGYYRGGTLLISGTAGSGKSSVAANFVDAACRRGEKCLYFAFEESPDQIIRNMRSIGIDLKHWADKGLLRFEAARPASFGLEMHLARIQRATEQFAPRIVVFDPISGFDVGESFLDARTMLMRMVDYLKSHQITSLFTSLTSGGGPAEVSEVGISSLIDTWVLLRNLEQTGERSRLLFILKARGMAHSNQVREFVMTNHGIDLVDVYLGPNGILTGSARTEQDAQDTATSLARSRDTQRKRLLIEHRRTAAEARIAEIRAALEVDRREIADAILEQESGAQERLAGRMSAGTRRQDSAAPKGAVKGAAKGKARRSNNP